MELGSRYTKPKKRPIVAFSEIFTRNFVQVIFWRIASGALRFLDVFLAPKSFEQNELPCPWGSMKRYNRHGSGERYDVIKCDAIYCL